MKSTTSAFLMGVLFAGGLGISQMTRPPKVLGFLDVLGDWDPTLLVVLAAATGTYFLGYRFLIPASIKQGVEACLAGKEEMNLKVLAGAAVFGIGWGMVGLCPGPAITDLFSMKHEIFIFVVGMILGVYATKAYTGTSK